MKALVKNNKASFSGIGGKSTTSEKLYNLPISIEGIKGNFISQELDHSLIPAILGLNGIERNLMMIIPHDQNSEFAAGNETRQKTASLTPPFGGPLNHDDEIYQFVAQTLSRLQQTCPDDSMLCVETMIDN